MNITIKRPQELAARVGVVSALRARAAKHAERHLQKAMRQEDGGGCYEDSRPYDLWTAKLLLEIAALFQATEVS